MIHQEFVFLRSTAEEVIIITGAKLVYQELLNDDNL